MDHHRGEPVERLDLTRLGHRLRQACGHERAGRLLGHRREKFEILDRVVGAATVGTEHDQADRGRVPAERRADGTGQLR